MSTLARLREWTPSAPLLLSESSLRRLAELGRLVDVRPAAGGRWIVSPKGVVGRLELHEGTLELLPKYPVANLCRMLAAASELPRLLEPVTTLGEGALPDLLVAAFVSRAEALVAAGLRRDYVEHHERLAALRGRLDLPVHLRRPEALVTELSCRHEEYTFDTLFNGVLRQTTEICRSRSPALAVRLSQLRHRLASLPLSRLRPPEIAQFRYDRFTEPYRPVHALCRLILEGTALGLGDGAAPGASFVVEMAPLFERFVSASLRARLGPPWRVSLQERTSLDTAAVIEIRPDIVVYRDDQAMAVIDAKYKLRRGGAPASDDAFQALAYARRYGVQRAMLVFPDRPAGIQEHLTHDRANAIATQGLDLGAPWSEVEGALDRLAETIRAPAG
ncbi:McrC family protein [Nannocystis bainbridge]|uniref:Restriction endonuclease n=1 Tax=Nannocystis bainbridge TaxID=2995303 RepID=A0ABT5E746_9BACT|nr:hypothetical protein [Nannocystis bainbridge]MDC0721686.1 hypothetical protein [Nannocystis bainbridge]